MRYGKKVLIDYSTSHVLSESLEIRMRIPNSYGYVKDVKAHFNMYGQKPGEGGNCYLVYDEEQSSEQESVFVGRIKFQTPGYRTFFIRMKINNAEKYVKYDPDKDEAVLSDMREAYNFWEVVSYTSGFTIPDSIRGGIMYQIFVDTFCSLELPERLKGKVVEWPRYPKWEPDEDGTYRNDQYYGGNLRGIISKLDYIKSLGVTVIYLTPILKGASSNRYDTVDYEKIDEMVGTWEDLDELHREANLRGMDLIIDAVFNHSSNENPLLKEKPEMYDWIEKFTKPKCWWGYTHLVEFNKYCEAFFIELTKWLKLYSRYVDGLRLDVADNLPEFVLKFIKSVFEKYLLGEVWKDAIIGEHKDLIYGDALDGVMNYQFTNAIYRYVRWGNAKHFRCRVNQIYRLYPKEALAGSPIFLSSHDIPRVRNILVGDFMKESEDFENVWDMEKDGYWHDSDGKFNTYRFRKWEVEHEEIPEDKKELAENLRRVAVFLQYTLPGLPSIFAGDEAGVNGFKDPTNRKPFPWDNIEQNSYDLYQTLGQFRMKYRDVFRSFDFKILEIDNEKLIYKRENFIFVVNRTDKGVNLPEYKDKKIVFSMGKFENACLSPYGVLVIE